MDFKPWSLELTVNDQKIAKQGGAGPQLSIQRIYTPAEVASLLRLALVVDAIEADSPAVSLAHLGDGRYDIDDVF